MHNRGKLRPDSDKRAHIRGYNGTYGAALVLLCITSACSSPSSTIQFHLVSSAWCEWWSWVLTLVQPPHCCSIQHKLRLTDTSLIAAQKEHVPFGNVSLCWSWLEEKYTEEAWSVSQQGRICPVGEIIWFRFWNSHVRAETVHENREWGRGHFSHLRHTWGRGVDVCGTDGMLAVFPWKWGAAQEPRLVVASPLISADWTFLHDWNRDNDIDTGICS